MNHPSSGLAGAFAGAWKAIVRAFTPSRPSGESQDYGADTTLFGPGPEPTGSWRAPSSAKDEPWDANGESSYFADAETTRNNERR